MQVSLILSLILAADFLNPLVVVVVVVVADQMDWLRPLAVNDDVPLLRVVAWEC